MTALSWNEFKTIYPLRFEALLTRVQKEYGVDRSGAIDILDTDFSFEQLASGHVQVTNETNGRHSTLPPG